ncbi:MAG: 50S ribosomal protein L4 [Candidatus Hydrogenedens sp.]|nr:50S ribosomal protein L4 [Candidatus Hydrogenedens sp.]
MASAPVYDMKGGQLGSLDLNDSVFGVETNEQVVKDVVVALQANARQGTHSVKGRNDVSGGGVKPFRQKGTGRARQGTIRAPQMRGGGSVHGPQPRSYRQAVSARSRKQALCCVLSERVRGEKLSVVRGLEASAPKTKPFAAMMSTLAPRTAEDLGMPRKSLLVTAEHDGNVALSVRNLATVVVRSAADVNALDILRACRVVVQEEAVAKLEERLS